MIHLTKAEHDELLAFKAQAERLDAIINTPELVDFPKAVMLEAAHQEQRWGSADREGKTPQEWFWLVGYLSGRALAHHKEAERLAGDPYGANGTRDPSIAYHREKAVHHTITAAAALAHWHASVLGKHTTMQPGHAKSAEVSA